MNFWFLPLAPFASHSEQKRVNAAAKKDEKSGAPKKGPSGGEQPSLPSLLINAKSKHMRTPPPPYKHVPPPLAHYYRYQTSINKPLQHLAVLA